MLDVMRARKFAAVCPAWIFFALLVIAGCSGGHEEQRLAGQDRGGSKPSPFSRFSSMTLDQEIAAVTFVPVQMLDDLSDIRGAVGKARLEGDAQRLTDRQREKLIDKTSLFWRYLALAEKKTFDALTHSEIRKIDPAMGEAIKSHIGFDHVPVAGPEVLRFVDAVFEGMAAWRSEVNKNSELIASLGADGTFFHIEYKARPVTRQGLEFDYSILPLDGTYAQGQSFFDLSSELAIGRGKEVLLATYVGYAETASSSGSSRVVPVTVRFVFLDQLDDWVPVSIHWRAQLSQPVLF